MEKQHKRLTSLALAMSLGLMTTLAGCEINPDGGGEGGEDGTRLEQPEYKDGEGGEGGEGS